MSTTGYAYASHSPFKTQFRNRRSHLIRVYLSLSEWNETVGELIRGLTPRPKSILNFFNFSAFQRTLAMGNQFIAGRESNVKRKV
jgi:hypothetical protein